MTVHQLATMLWARRYGFFAIPAMPQQSLVLVRPRGGGEVRLDCAGVLTGWAPLDDRFELLRVRLTGRLYEPIVHPGAGACHAGGHWIEGDGPFSRRSSRSTR